MLAETLVFFVYPSRRLSCLVSSVRSQDVVLPSCMLVTWLGTVLNPPPQPSSASCTCDRNLRYPRWINDIEDSDTHFGIDTLHSPWRIYLAAPGDSGPRKTMREGIREKALGVPLFIGDPSTCDFSCGFP